MIATENDARWEQVVARDAQADGQFYFSVKTTGVYCRPSCAARRPRPENVAFHETAAAAEAAGFRPCLRCRPNEELPEAKRAALVAAACELIEGAETIPDLTTLAGQAGLSVSHFHRMFKAATGVTPKAYAAARREERMRARLSAGEHVTDAIYGAGYGSNGRFYAKSNEVLGMTASAYRTGGQGESIQFAIGDCSLGRVLAARSERGVCAILLGDDDEALRRDLQQRFPRAEVTVAEEESQALLAQVAAMVETPAQGLHLPLDIQGTAFQQRVWEALRAIPAGATASYAEVASAIGSPQSVRAVAQACGANPLAIAIPCHRVVRSGGAISGYRWGVHRKKQLLEREQPLPAQPANQ